jgi:hypothetical protein
LTAEEWTVACPHVDCVYLDPGWLRTIAAVYPKLRVLRLACFDGPTRLWLLPLVAIRPLLRRAPTWTSVAFGNYGGFVAVAEMPDEIWLRSLRALETYFLASGAARLEIRGNGSLTGFTTSRYFKRFTLPVQSGEERLWNDALTTNARNMIRKAQKASVVTEVDPPGGLETFQQFYELQAKEHGTPIHALDWFPALRREFGPRCYSVVASIEGRPVGASLLLDGMRTSYLHAVAWSRDHRQIPIADLLYWSSIRETIARGKDELDFGRTRPVNGQLFFKRKWGGQESELPYSYLVRPGGKIPLVVPESGKYRWATRIWRSLPLPVLQQLGPRLRSHIPS